MSKVTDFLKKITKPTFYILVLLVLLSFLWILWEIRETYQSGTETFLQWMMDLLLVPASLAAAGIWFARIQKKTEVKLAKEERDADRAIADEKRRQQTFENYIDRMSNLLLEKDLGAEEGTRPEVLRLARTLTLNVLRELLAERNKQVTQFLQESDLLGKNKIIPLSGANLSGADLSGADLREANLRGADLREADLREADLRGANLRGAKLFGADLLGADLREADLRGAKLFGADLRGADLRGADLSEADLSEADLLWTNLNGADLRGAKLFGADLSEADLSEADLRWTNLRRTKLRNCKYNDKTIWPDDFDPNTIPDADNKSLSEGQEESVYP